MVCGLVGCDRSCICPEHKVRSARLENLTTFVKFLLPCCPIRCWLPFFRRRILLTLASFSLNLWMSRVFRTVHLVQCALCTEKSNRLHLHSILTNPHFIPSHSPSYPFRFRFHSAPPSIPPTSLSSHRPHRPAPNPLTPSAHETSPTSRARPHTFSLTKFG